MWEKVHKIIKKAEFVQLLREKLGLEKHIAEKITNSFLDGCEDGLVKDKKITLRGFGTFEVIACKERKGKNLQTGEIITIPEYSSIRFTPSDSLKMAINKKD